ncbi:MAG TPA: hypothetical protein VMH87_10330 [Pseudomonadales bacterium]|nr:hypothetical protein [Pseudomonadales bacterium]
MNTELHAVGEAPKTFPVRLKLPVSRKKAVEYLGMFTLLTIIYYCYFVRDARVNDSSPIMVVTPGEFSVVMVKFFLFTGWPFLFLSYFDSSWRSKDAGNVFLLAWIATNVLWYHQTGCAFCIFSASFKIIPYALCAWIAHGLGALYCRSPRNES